MLAGTEIDDSKSENNSSNKSSIIDNDEPLAIRPMPKARGVDPEKEAAVLGAALGGEDSDEISDPE